jgi:hypothetical protein
MPMRRAVGSMHEPVVVCMVIRAGRGVEGAQLRQIDFPATMAVAVVMRVSQMAPSLWNLHRGAYGTLPSRHRG